MKKKVNFLILFSFIILTINCERNAICPDKPEYHFFTDDELKLLWENVDSALILQNKLRTAEIEQYATNNAYGKINTIQFINQTYDTLNFTFRYRLSPGINQWCANEIPMISESSIYANEECFIKSIEIELEKNITDKLIYKIEFWFDDGMELSTSFSLSDSIRIDYNIFNGSLDKSTKIYSKTYFDKYQYKNEILDSCLFFLFIDQNQTEKFKVVYSNKYGFLKLKKNMNYEIERQF